MHARSARFVVTCAAALASCFPAYEVGNGSDGGTGPDGGDATADSLADVAGDRTSDAAQDATAEASPEAGGDSSSNDTGAPSDASDASDASDVSIPPFDGGPLTPVPSCGDMSGLEANAPWPMEGYCPARRRRSPLPGPGATMPMVHWHQMPQADGGASPVDGSITPLLTSNGLVLTVSTHDSSPGNTALTAFDATTGAQRWVWTPPGADDIYGAPAIGADDVVYVPCLASIYGVALNGTQLWQSASARATRSSILVGPGPVLYVDDPNLELWSLASDGGDRWTSKFLLAVDNQAPMSGVLEAGLAIFQTMENGSLWTVPPSGGAPSNVWPGDEGGSNETVFAVAAPDGNIRLINQTDNRVWSVTPSGGLVWTYPALDAGAPDIPRVPAVDDDGNTYAAYQGGTVVAIGADGHQLWSTAPTTPLCNAITLDPNGVLYTGCDQGLQAYATAGSGTPLWTMNPSSQTGLNFGVAIGWYGWLYVTASDGNIYAVGP